MNTFADRVMEFYGQLNFTGVLPRGIQVMNPIKESDLVLSVVDSFYKKFYGDNRERHLILGINPGRLGGGTTGIPFTDTRRLVEQCGIAYNGKPSHEPSSVFIYEMISAYGGATKFYNEFYINSVCPLGFTATGNNGKAINYNYYDAPALAAAATPFILQSIQQQLQLGVSREVCFCFGMGKNERFLRRLNEANHFFNRIVALEHPRYIIQYKSANKQQYIEKYLAAFRQVAG